MKIFTKLLFTLALTLVGLGGAKAEKLYWNPASPWSGFANCKWTAETNTFSWDGTHTVVRAIQTGFSGDLSAYTTFHATISNMSSGVENLWLKINSEGGTEQIIYLYNGENNIDLTNCFAGINSANVNTFELWGPNIGVTNCSAVLTDVYLEKAENMEAQTTRLYLAGDWGTTIEDVELTGNVVLNYKNGYAAINLLSSSINTSDYKGFELELADDAPVDNLQINFGSDKGEGTVDDYTGPLNTTSYTGYFPSGAITVNKISLQACNVPNLGRVEIKSFYLIDNSDNKVATIYEIPPSWAMDYLVYEATLAYTTGGQWNYGALKGGEGMLLPVTITVNAESFPENVQFNIGTTAQVPNWNNEVGDRHEYRGLPAGGTSLSVDIDAVEDDETIRSIELQHTQATDPFKIKHLSGTISQYRKITVGSAGFTTFSPKLPIAVAGVVTAYAAKYNGERVVLTPVSTVPADAGIIVEAAEGTYKAPVIASAAAITDNDLLVSDGTVTGNGSIYALGKKNGVVGFYRVADGETVPAGKAYLTISSTARDFYALGDETTGISDAKRLNNNEQIINNNWYDLQGRKVNGQWSMVNGQLKKGLYIVNGKKVIIK